METLEFIVNLIVTHWPFAAVAISLMVVGNVSKTQFITKKRALEATRFRWLWMNLWRTFPLHPMFTGAVIGYFWQNPEPGIVGIAASFYFMAAGATSVFLYQVLKSGFKHWKIGRA